MTSLDSQLASLDLIQGTGLKRFGATEGGAFWRRNDEFAPHVTGHRLWHGPWIKSRDSETRRQEAPP